MHILFRKNISHKLFKFVTGILLFLTILVTLKWYLTKNEPIDANILVVEGWLPYFGIQMTINEFNNHKYDFVITTGLEFEEFDYYEISRNGYLTFYPHFDTNSDTVKKHHYLEVLAHNNKRGNNFSHFVFYINDSIIADTITDNDEYMYGVNWKGALTEIDSFMVQLDNHTENYLGYRNLYILGIRIDDTIIIPYKNNSVMDIGLLDGKDRITNNYDSYAGKAKMELIANGIDSSRIIAVPCKNVSKNRTLTSAIACKEWLEISNLNIKGINIVSQGIHSRRTWMTYHKILGKRYDIGIISLPENEKPESKIPNIFKISYEIIGTLYYWFILTFIHT